MVVALRLREGKRAIHMENGRDEVVLEEHTGGIMPLS